MACGRREIFAARQPSPRSDKRPYPGGSVTRCSAARGKKMVCGLIGHCPRPPKGRSPGLDAALSVPTEGAGAGRRRPWGRKPRISGWVGRRRSAPVVVVTGRAYWGIGVWTSRVPRRRPSAGIFEAVVRGGQLSELVIPSLMTTCSGHRRPLPSTTGGTYGLEARTRNFCRPWPGPPASSRISPW